MVHGMGECFCQHRSSLSGVVPLCPMRSFFSQCSSNSSPPRKRQAILVQTCMLNLPRGFVVSMELRPEARLTETKERQQLKLDEQAPDS